MADRVIVLIDMDCFYCQVETKLNPSLFGKPLAVVQYNAWKGGGIIAVNYEARDRGVTRFMRGDDAKKQCPEIQLVSVPTIRDKADLSKYRDASRDVIAVLCSFCDTVERASIDEAFLDLTASVKQKLQSQKIEPSQISNTFVVGYSKEKCNDEDERSSGTTEWLKDIYSDDLIDDDSKNLAIGASIVEEIRAEVYKKTGFRCSAGIAHNKILAKLVCGLHKPNRQTVLPHGSVSHLYNTLPVKKIRYLGGKLGDEVMEKLNCKLMADLSNYSEKELKSKFDEKIGSWLFNIARGIDSDPVKPRLIPKSIGCCKRFPGKSCLKNKVDVTFWLKQLSEELTERILEDQSMNKRKAQLLTISMTLTGYQTTSKSISLTSYDYDKIYDSAFNAVKKICSNAKEDTWMPIFCLGLSASKFQDFNSSGTISNFFSANPLKKMFTDTTVEKKMVNSPIESINSLKHKNNISFFKKVIDNNSSLGTNLKSIPSKSDSTVENENKIEEIEPPKEENKDLISPDSNCGDEEVTKPLLESTVKHIEEEKILFQNNNVLVSEKVSGKSCSSSVKKSGHSIQDFFKNGNICQVVNPLDVFPDLNEVDDELLKSFPLSFQKKVSILKKELEIKKSVSKKSSDQSNDEIQSHENNVEINETNNSKSDVDTNSSVISNKNTSNTSEQSTTEKPKNWEGEDIFEDSGDEAVNNEPTGKISKYFNSDTITCEECGKSIEMDDFPEHSDFHIAEKINLELNGLPGASTSRILPVSNLKVQTAPCKRKYNKKTKLNETKKFKSLNNFFSSR